MFGVRPATRSSVVRRSRYVRLEDEEEDEDEDEEEDDEEDGDDKTLSSTSYSQSRHAPRPGERKI